MQTKTKNMCTSQNMCAICKTISKMTKTDYQGAISPWYTI